MNKVELQAEMKRKGFTYESMSKALGISENAFWRKMNGVNDFTLPEIQTITEKLELDDTKIKVIFFN
mgnify:FL=1